MKKILMGSAVLSALALSIIAFQISCSKSANAQTSGTTGLTQQNKIIYGVNDGGSSYTWWIANTDGTNQTIVPISAPKIKIISLLLSPDGQKFYFGGLDSTSNLKRKIYSCNLDGTNIKLLVDPKIMSTRDGAELFDVK